MSRPIVLPPIQEGAQAHYTFDQLCFFAESTVKNYLRTVSVTDDDVDAAYAAALKSGSAKLGLPQSVRGEIRAALECFAARLRGTP